MSFGDRSAEMLTDDELYAMAPPLPQQGTSTAAVLRCDVMVTRDGTAFDADAIIALRRRLGFTQEAFAAAVGVSVSTANRWERGHGRPSPLACRAMELVALRVPATTKCL